MLIKKCDACGATFETYGAENEPENASGIILINVDKHGRYFENDPLDLCPSCMGKVYEVLGMKKAVE